MVIPVPPLLVEEPAPDLPPGGGNSAPPAITGSSTPPPLPVADWQEKPHRPNEIVVLVNGEGAEETRLALMRDYNLLSSAPRPVTLLGSSMLSLTIPDQRPLADVLAAVTADPRVIAAQVNFVYQLMEGPDAPPPADAAPASPNAGESAPASPGQTQYNLDALKVPEAHSLATGRDVLVAVVDTCIDSDHPELGGSLADSFDAVAAGAASQPAPGGVETCQAAEKHGTSVAGIIAAHRTLSSVAPKAKLLSVRAFSAAGATGRKAESTTHALVAGIDWALSKGARIMNLSFAGPDDPLLKRLIGEASQRGAILVAAAGNGGPAAAPLYPAAYEGVVAVTAVDAAKRVYGEANRGAYITLAAPGVDILLATPENGYAVDSGTSYAAAHVSGIAALMLERNPALEADKLRNGLVQTTARPSEEGGPEVYGAGLADAFGAVAAAAGDRAVSSSEDAKARR